jgi:hypothetical protein
MSFFIFIQSRRIKWSKYITGRQTRDERFTQGCSQNGSKQRKPGREVYMQLRADNQQLSCVNSD